MKNEDFYRRCWLTLKAGTVYKKQNRLRLQMDEIECLTGGVKIIQPSPKKSEETKNGPAEPNPDEEIVV